MKTKTLLIAAVMFLGLTAAAFAQATYSVGSLPVTAVINTGQVERTGDVTFTQTSGTSNTGTITISYGVPITVAFSSVIVTGTSGTYCPTGGCTTPPTAGQAVTGLSINASASSNSAGVLVINVPSNMTSGSFSVSGVRVAVAGTTLTTLNASISTTNNAIVAGQTAVTVISSIGAGIASIKTTTVGEINATTGTATTAPAVITIKEGFLNAFGDTANSTEAGVRITLSAAPPAGVTITFPATASSNGVTPVANPTWTTINGDGSANGAAVPITSTSASLAVYYRASTTTDPTKQETLTINVAIDTSNVKSSSLPLTAGSITYVVSLAPIGTAFNADGSVITNGLLIPRYAASDVGPATLLNIVGTTTTLLVPFAQTVTSAGYNTGFAIANTTADPGDAAGLTSPVAQSGVLTFYFFPANTAGGTAPADFSYTTSASSPGTGLDATGKLPSGSTYTVLLSQLLAAASAPADFSGYIFIQANFTNAHCLFVVSNFTTFSQGALALVVPSDRTVTLPESLNN